MSKEMLLGVVGTVVLLFPFFGLPGTFESILAVLAGAVVISIAVLMRKENMEREVRRKEVVVPVMEEVHRPIPTPVYIAPEPEPELPRVEDLPAPLPLEPVVEVPAFVPAPISVVRKPRHHKEARKEKEIVSVVEEAPKEEIAVSVPNKRKRILRRKKVEVVQM